MGVTNIRNLPLALSLKPEDIIVISQDGVTKVLKGKLLSVSSYELPIATSNVLGGVLKGENILIEADGTLSIETATYKTRGVANFSESEFLVTNGLVNLRKSYSLSNHSHIKTLINKSSSGGVLTLSDDEYQKWTNVSDATEIRLPSVSGLVNINLKFDTTTNLTLILPNCRWSITPEFKANKTYELIFSYDGSKWLGGVVEYGV